MKNISIFLAQIFSNDFYKREQEFIRNHHVSELLFVYGSSIVSFLFFIVSLSTLGFFLKIPLHWLYAPFSFFFSSVFAYWLINKSIKSKKILNLFIVLTSLCGTVSLFSFLQAKTVDISYDGQAYHQEAIIKLQSGWNPVYKQLSGQEANELERWLNHYSKAPWIYESVWYSFTGNIESGKLFQLLLMVSAFSIFLSFLLKVRNLNPNLGLLVSFLGALSPVSIYQSMSYYLDGQLYSLLLGILGLVGLIYLSSRNYILVPFFMAVSIFINVKLTAIFYLGILMMGFLIFLWLSNKVLRAYKFVVCLSLAVAFGLLFLGWNPYVTNTIFKGHPFHPAMGHEALDYRTPNLPQNFLDKPGPLTLIASIFSKSANVRAPQNAEIKFPFSFYQQELKAFTDTNPKEGGWGVFFGGSIVISLIIIVSSLINLYFEKKNIFKEQMDVDQIHQHEELGVYRNESRKLKLTLFASTVIFVSAGINPSASLARFVPQIWLIPLLASIYGISQRRDFVKVLGVVNLVVLLLNNYLIASTYINHNVQKTMELNEKLNVLSQSSLNGSVSNVYLGEFRSSAIWKLNQYGVRYSETIEERDCANFTRIIPESIVRVCSNN
jgi:hypothetical protein